MKGEAHQGSCLCQRVRFVFEGSFARFFLCHCHHCRKDTGSAHAANLFAPTGDLQWLSGADQVRRFSLPGTRHVRSFCGHCGTALPYQDVADGFYVVPAGCLDSTLALRPDAHLFADSRAGWDRELDQLPSFPALPS